MGNYILSHDIGTSSDKAVLVTFTGEVAATCSVPYPTYYPNPAWVEQDPADYWKAVSETSRRIVEENGLDPSEIKGIVFSTQAQGVIPVDEEGTPLYNNITWVDGRAQEQAEHIMKKVGGKKIFTLLAGTPIMGKDCIAEITWLKEERPEIYEKTHLILDVNGWLKFKCTGKMVTELSGASSYGLDLKKKTWLSVFPLVGIDMLIVLANTGIGIFQEIRSKQTLDKLKFLKMPKAQVYRDGFVTEVRTEELVLGDVVVLGSGNQIPADAVVVDGSVQVNESLITGEADEITKTADAQLLSGSFIVSGECTAELTAVGKEAYINKLTVEATKHKDNDQSEMIKSLDRLVKTIGIIIIPVGIILFVQQVFILDGSFRDSVISMVAAILGMIPEGLYMDLTS